MARQVVFAHPPVGSTQVWASLSPELQERTVRLLAHLAWLCATAPVEQLRKEPCDGVLRPSNQNSSRPS